VPACFPEVRVQQQDFDVSDLQRELLDAAGEVGAVASFTGVVRGNNDHRHVAVMELEHYPGMTERSIQKIIDAARARWVLMGVRVVHRVGSLKPGEQIVYVGVSGAHRGEAFQACEFIMDYLKTRAPFWKREIRSGGQNWVENRESDLVAARRWED
jgi:molybdopterin synthase catalytic subunit